MHVPHLPWVPEGELLHKDVGHADPVASSWDMVQRVAFVDSECSSAREQESESAALMVVDQRCWVVVGMRLVEVACKRRVGASDPCLVTDTSH